LPTARTPACGQTCGGAQSLARLQATAQATHTAVKWPQYERAGRTTAGLYARLEGILPSGADRFGVSGPRRLDTPSLAGDSTEALAARANGLSGTAVAGRQPRACSPSRRQRSALVA